MNATATLITKSEAARVLGLSRETVVRMVKAGTLHEIRLGPGMNPRLRLEDVLRIAAGETGD